MADTWKEIWEARRLDPAYGSILAQLLAADGFDMPFGRISDKAWNRHVSRTAEAIGIVPGSSVFEVGCGAGAFLYELERQGCVVAGLDASSALIRHAGQVMPRGTWIQADAAELDVSVPYDFVLASACFHYFPTLEYAKGVLERMVRKARRGVAVLDVPDLAKRDAAIAVRSRLAGEETYARKYDDVEHLYFERIWFQATLAGAGVTDVQVVDQQIDGYANSAHRFNVYGLLAGTDSVIDGEP
jgi:trans-aconitate methyltransferase